VVEAPADGPVVDDVPAVPAGPPPAAAVEPSDAVPEDASVAVGLAVVLFVAAEVELPLA
jgi:hypothetical protein